MTDDRNHSKARAQADHAWPTLLEGLPSGVVVVHADGQLKFNRAVEQVIGYGRGEIHTLEQWYSVLYGDKAAQVRAEHENEVRRLFGSNSAPSSAPIILLTPVIRKDGAVRHIEINVNVDHEGVAIWSLNDVSERVAAQERLRFVFEEGRRIENRLRRTADALNEAQSLSKTGSFEIDLVHARREWSVQAALNFGLPSHIAMEVVEWLSYVAVEDQPQANSEWNETLAGAREFDRELKIKRGDEGEAFLHVRARAVRAGDGRIVRVVGTFQDVTDHRRQVELIRSRELKLLQTSKLSSVGKLVSGVIHEIRNSLAVISGGTRHIGEYVEVFVDNVAQESVDSLSLKSKLTRQSERINVSVERIARMLETLRSFTRDSSKDPLQAYPLDTIIEETAQLCTRRFEHHQIQLKLPDLSAGRILECRPAEIGRVILNLLNNAFDAVQGCPNPQVAIEIEDRGTAWELALVDNGRGIPQDVADRIFEPFFTGQDNKGAGLGLSTADDLVRSYGGSIRLESGDKSRGAGTRFIVSLPKRQRSQAQNQAA